MADEWVSGTIEVPEMLVASPRKHQQLVRAALVEELERHHRETMPKHFEAGNATKYRHAPRTEKYRKIRRERYGSDVDLVKTRRTLKAILGSHQVKVSGSANAGTIRGRLSMRLPFGGGTGRQMSDDAYARIEKFLAAAFRGAKTDTQRRYLERKHAAALKKLANRRNERGKTGVTPADIAKELQRITTDEVREITRGLGAHYVASIKAMKRKRLLSGVRLPD